MMKTIVVAIAFTLAGAMLGYGVKVGQVKTYPDPKMFHEIYESDNAVIDKLTELGQINADALGIMSGAFECNGNVICLDIALSNAKSKNSSYQMRTDELHQLQQNRWLVMTKWKAAIGEK